MGQMKAYAMWLEEQGYVEYVDTPDGGYVATDKHPGENEALTEYMENRDARRTG